MKKIKPQYGRVIPPAVNVQQTDKAEIETSKAVSGIGEDNAAKNTNVSAETKSDTAIERSEAVNFEKGDLSQKLPIPAKTDTSPRITSATNPFLQTKEIFGKTRLTKVGYRVRTDFVETLDIIKKMKKNGYTLEAVLDDALAFYFENSEDGREAVKKAELFYS